MNIYIFTNFRLFGPESHKNNRVTKKSNNNPIMIDELVSLQVKGTF